MTPLVSVRDLRLRRGSFALSVPAWDVAPGTVVGLVGPNGAGKSTLLRAAFGLLRSDAGTLSVAGADPWTRPEIVRTECGFMADDLPLWPIRIDRLLRRLSGYYATWDPELVDVLLERFDLDSRARSDRLSKGQGTRLRLLLAMAHRPRLLLLDEPATGLDVAGRRALLATVLEIVQDPGCSVVVSSHQLVDVQRIADELLIVNDGEVVRQGPTDELVGDARTLEEAMVEWGAV